MNQKLKKEISANRYRILSSVGIFFFILLISQSLSIKTSGEAATLFSEIEQTDNASTTDDSCSIYEKVKLPILTYPSVRPKTGNEDYLLDRYIVTPEKFESQLQYLKDNDYKIVSFDYLSDAILNHKIVEDRTIILSFDDGWESQYTYAYPILKKFGMIATFFIFTNAIDHNSFFTWDQLKEMSDSGMSIESHTRSHPYLYSIGTDDGLRYEIKDSKKIIEDKLGKPVKYFAYPFGQHDEKIQNIVKESGYYLARSSNSGIYNGTNDMYKLKSVEVTDDVDQMIRDLE